MIWKFDAHVIMLWYVQPFYITGLLSVVSMGHQWHPLTKDNPDSKVHGANMGPIWGRQDPGGPHVGPKNFAIWEEIRSFRIFFNVNLNTLLN